MQNLQLTNSKKVDLREYISKVIEQREKSENNANLYIKENNKIKIDEDRDLYINRINLTYKESENIQIEYLTIEGYILIK